VREPKVWLLFSADREHIQGSFDLTLGAGFHRLITLPQRA
jgi:hypothetical protein